MNNTPEESASSLRKLLAEREAKSRPPTGDESPVSPLPFGRLFIEEDGPGAKGQISPSLTIHCPICGFNYNHISAPRTLTGWESSHGNTPSPASSRWSGRGDGFALPMACEEGHNWLLCVGFHKGKSFLFALPDSEATPDEGGV